MHARIVPPKRENCADDMKIGVHKPTSITVGADHAGFELRQFLRDALIADGYTVKDSGVHKFNPDDDYPHIARVVASYVKRHKGSLGIAICGSGQGVCIAANRMSGVRAVSAWDEQSARTSRNDDNANVLCLGARLFTKNQALAIAREWLTTPFSNEERHKRRIRILG